MCLPAIGLTAALDLERNGTLPLRAAIGHALLWTATMETSPVAGAAMALVWS